MSGPRRPAAADPDLDAGGVAARHARGEVQLVDVREPYEWEAGRIAGARHLPLSALAGQAATLDPGRPVVFYCRVGARSRMAALLFRRSGYDAWSLAGGLAAWEAEGRPLEPEGGVVAPH